MKAGLHPILTCEEAGRLEADLLKGDEQGEWSAMRRAGQALAKAIVGDFAEIGGLVPNGRVLVLAGKGHNAGDALIAARTLLGLCSGLVIEVFFVLGQRKLRPLTQRAWRELVEAAPERVRAVRELDQASRELVIDGVFGFSFRPPLDEKTAALFRRVNALTGRLRAAVDLPSGLDDGNAFRADFTYATGSVKTTLLTLPVTTAGRLRYLDLDFFSAEPSPINGLLHEYVISDAVLAALRGLRPAGGDKRTYGHLAVLGGSRRYPGAVLMSVRAALRSGVGLVTALVPESLAPAFAAQVPEAMWVGWPETPDGGLALEGLSLLSERLERVTALLIGPGLGRERETLALVKEVVKTVDRPCVLDADALQPELVRMGRENKILTPHAGEFERIARGAGLREFCAETKTVTVLKGARTRVGGVEGIAHSFFGGPLLARGGSGDMLGGLIGGLLAQTPDDAFGVAVRGTVWHGLAADLLARAHGQVAVNATQLLDFLPTALRAKR